MQIFLSWSGAQSRAIAAQFREWAPLVLHYLKPWMSDVDIKAGDRWAKEIGSVLEGCSFGIIFLTKENLKSTWLHFEAGALVKAVDEGRLIPLLFDVDITEVEQPLSWFQARIFNKETTLEVLKNINEHSEEKIDDTRMEKLFAIAWDNLKSAIDNAPAPNAEDIPTRSSDEILEDVVSNVKSIQRMILDLEAKIGAPEASEYEIKSANGLAVEEELNRAENFLSIAKRLSQLEDVDERKVLKNVEKCQKVIKDLFIKIDLRDNERSRAREIIKLANMLLSG